MTTHKEFVEAVREMRRLQKLWFGGDKSKTTLEARGRFEERRAWREAQRATRERKTSGKIV